MTTTRRWARGPETAGDALEAIERAEWTRFSVADAAAAGLTVPMWRRRALDAAGTGATMGAAVDLTGHIRKER